MARPFTAEDFAARIKRAGSAIQEAGLSGVLVTPGPDLLYFTGYAPTAITERLTMLVVAPDREPAMIVPTLERPDAEAAPGSSNVELSDWADGSDPYKAAAPLLDPKGRYAISDATWAIHVLGLQARLPETVYASMTTALPTLRAVKDPDELERLTAAGEAADAALYDILEVRFSGRTEADIAADLADALIAHGHSEVEFTLVGSGPNGANPHHEFGERVIEEGDMVVLDFGGIVEGYSSDTTRTVHVGGWLRGCAARGRVPGDRPRCPQGDLRCRLRRAVHPPDRARNRPDGARAAVPRRGRGARARARDVLLDRARDLPSR
jgi:D-alanyl-D-alanine dipeptidase